MFVSTGLISFGNIVIVKKRFKCILSIFCFISNYLNNYIVFKWISREPLVACSEACYIIHLDVLERSTKLFFQNRLATLVAGIRARYLMNIRQMLWHQPRHILRTIYQTGTL
jgi:hypothetical protein